MSQFKSKEYIESDSSESDSNFDSKPKPKLKQKQISKRKASPVYHSDSDDDFVEKKPKKEKVKEKRIPSSKEKRVQSSKEKRVLSSKLKITKKDTRDKRKRELSPPSSEDDDLPPMKKVEPKRVPDKKKGNKPPRDAESVCADVSEMKNIGVNRYVGILEFKGKKYLNIREYYEDSGGLKPGKKGVSLVRDQWNNLRESFFDIDEKMFTATDEDVCPIDLGRNKRVRVTKFKGKWLLIDIRETYMKDGEECPGKKGIALKPEQYGRIKELQEEIDSMW